MQSTSVRADGVERYVRMMFEQWQQPPDWAQRIRERSVHVKPRATTDSVAKRTQDADRTTTNSDRATQEGIEARLSRYRQALLDGLVDYATGAAEIRRLEVELESLAQPAEDVGNALLASEQLTDIGDLWPLMSPKDQQRFIKLALEAVVIDSDNGTVVGVVPHADYAAIFDVAAEDEGSRLGVVTWRPRADSNRRSPRHHLAS